MKKFKLPFVGLVTILGMTITNTAQAATIYTFTPISGTATGTLEFASPPSTSSNAWSTTNPAVDVIAMDFILDASLGLQTMLGGSVGYVFENVNTIESYNGIELDAGTMLLRAPRVIGPPGWNFIFSDQAGGDEINVTVGGNTAPPVTYYAFGDWTTTSVVPVPASVWLFGSGLLALVGTSRRTRNKV